MLAVRVGPDDGVIMEALSEQGLPDHCVIVDGSTIQRGESVSSVNDVITTSSSSRIVGPSSEQQSPCPHVVSSNILDGTDAQTEREVDTFPQPVTRIIYHSGSAALLVGQQIIHQPHSVLHQDEEEEQALLEEQAMSPQHPHHLHPSHHHHHQVIFKTEVDHDHGHDHIDHLHEHMDHEHEHVHDHDHMDHMHEHMEHVHEHEQELEHDHENLRAHSALIDASHMNASASNVISEESNDEMADPKHMHHHHLQHHHHLLLRQAVDGDNSDTVYQSENELKVEDPSSHSVHPPGTILIMEKDLEDDNQCDDGMGRAHAHHHSHHHLLSHHHHQQHHHQQHHHLMDKEPEMEMEDGDVEHQQLEEHERHHHNLHHHHPHHHHHHHHHQQQQSHLLGALVSNTSGGRLSSAGNSLILTDGGSAEHRLRDTMDETERVCTVVHGSTPTIIISSGSSANVNSMSTTTAKHTSMSSSSSSSATLTGSSCHSSSGGGGELGGRGSAQHWLSAASTNSSSPSAAGAGTLIDSSSNNTTTRLVVVTSNPSSAQQTLSLHRIISQVKHELIQTAAEDLSLPNSNNNNNHNNNNNNSTSGRSSSSTRAQQQQSSPISPLIIHQGRLSASGIASSTALRGDELSVIVGRNRQSDYLSESAVAEQVGVDTRIRQSHTQDYLQHHTSTQHHPHLHLHHHHEPDSEPSNSSEEQMSCGQEHLHHAHHHQHHHTHHGHATHHSHHHHPHHHHHHHHNHTSHLEEEVEEEEEEEPNSPTNTNNTDGHIEADRLSMSSMIDASEFRALHAAATAEEGYQVALTTVHNGRLSPTGFSPGTSSSSQYATLTPLQPLPPISTMTDKFSYGHAGSNVAGSFTVMQHNGLAGLALAANPYSNYEKLPSMCVSPPHHYSASPINGLPSEHLSSSQTNGMRSDHLSSPPPKSPANGYSPSAFSSNDQSSRIIKSSPSLSPSPLHSSTSNHLPANSPPHSSGQIHHHHHHSSAVSSLLIHHPQSVVTSGISNGVDSPESEHSLSPVATAVVVAHREPASPGRCSSSPPMSVVFSGPSATHPHISHTQSVSTVLSSSGSVKQQQQSVVTVVSSVGSPGVVTLTATPAGSGASVSSTGSGGTGELEEINTKELAAKISAELKRYSIPQAIFAQRVLCRSQGTLSDLLRNPKPWSKLKSGRETFRRMWKWLQEPEFQRMSALRLAGKPTLSSNPSFASPSCPTSSSTGATFSASANTTHENDHHLSLLLYQHHGPMSGIDFVACKRKEEQQTTTTTTTPSEPTPTPKKPRLVFTDLQRRTLQAIFKETKRPSKEMQVTIARQLGLEPTTVGNFFMNARRRSMDKWKEDGDLSGSKEGGGSSGSSSSSGSSNSPSSTMSGPSAAHSSQPLNIGPLQVAQVVTVHHTPTTIMSHSGNAQLDNSDPNL